MPTPEISIIIVNYYSENDILECCRSIQKYSSIAYETIIVSNSPLDTSSKELFEQYDDQIIMHETRANLGFGRACNIGANLASGKYLFFLNPDTRFRNDVLKELQNYCLTNFEVGVLGPKTYDKYGKPEPTAKSDITIGFFANQLFPFLKLILSSVIIGEPYTPKKRQLVPIINGHAMFIDATFFSELGGFDPRFFMYWEENDLCLRVRKKNRSVAYCSEAKLTHIKSTTTSKKFLEMEVEKHLSQKKFIKKNYPKLLFANRISGILGYCLRLIFSSLTININKVQQFGTIFLWYCFNYKNNPKRPS